MHCRLLILLPRFAIISAMSPRKACVASAGVATGSWVSSPSRRLRMSQSRLALVNFSSGDLVLVAPFPPGMGFIIERAIQAHLAGDTQGSQFFSKAALIPPCGTGLCRRSRGVSRWFWSFELLAILEDQVPVVHHIPRVPQGCGMPRPPTGGPPGGRGRVQREEKDDAMPAAEGSSLQTQRPGRLEPKFFFSPQAKGACQAPPVIGPPALRRAFGGSQYTKIISLSLSLSFFRQGCGTRAHVGAPACCGAKSEALVRYEG